VRYFSSHNMLVSCFFWATIFGARVIFWGDPYLNSTTVLFDIGRNQPNERSIYIIRLRLHNFYSSFISSPYDRSVEENWILFKQCTLNIIDEAKCIKNHQNLPRVNKDIRHKIKKRKKLHDHEKALVHGHNIKIKNKITANLRSAHDAYCNHLFDSSNHKRLWS